MATAIEEEEDFTLLDLPRRDITYPKIFPLLSFGDILNLRCSDKRFHKLVDEYFAKELNDINANESALSTDEFHKYSEAVNNLRSLSIANMIELRDGPWSDVFVFSPRLRSLDMSGTFLTGATLQIVVTNCRNLRHLHLARCKWVDNGCVQVMALHLKNLLCIDLSSTSVDDKASLFELLRSNKALERINFSCIEVVDVNLIKGIIQLCTSLRLLVMQHCHRLNTDDLRWLCSKVLPEKVRKDFRGCFSPRTNYLLDQIMAPSPVTCCRFPTQIKPKSVDVKT